MVSFASRPSRAGSGEPPHAGPWNKASIDWFKSKKWTSHGSSDHLPRNHRRNSKDDGEILWVNHITRRRPRGSGVFALRMEPTVTNLRDHIICSDCFGVRIWRVYCTLSAGSMQNYGGVLFTLRGIWIFIFCSMFPIGLNQHLLSFQAFDDELSRIRFWFLPWGGWSTSPMHLTGS